MNKSNFSELAHIIAWLDNADSVYAFLRDLMTEDEMKECVFRWKIVQLLNSGTSYSQIEKKTGASSTTIARVSHWLNHGMWGYKNVLQSHKKIGL